jgi:hypothetical protein
MADEPKDVLIRLLVDQPHGKANDEVQVTATTARILCDVRDIARRSPFSPELMRLIIEARKHPYEMPQ